MRLLPLLEASHEVCLVGEAMNPKPKQIKKKREEKSSRPKAVSVDAATQGIILSLVLNQKINVLTTARERFAYALQHNPPSNVSISAAITGIDAEVSLCLSALSALANNTPIQFPSPAEMAALGAAVQVLGNATAKGVTTAALIPAVANVIATFPG
jgi:hypothetical protein